MSNNVGFFQFLVNPKSLPFCRVLSFYFSFVVFLFLLFVFQAFSVYLQFGFLEVLSVAFCFLLPASLASFFILRRPLSEGERLKGVDVFLSLILAVIGWLLANTFYDGMFLNYFRTFPVVEAELGLGWTQDTAFHVSLIQSILNFGYPSTAQHGAPVTYYHVLSHYVDALVLKITGLEPLDSYGLLGWFKIFAFVVGFSALIGALLRSRSPALYAAVLILTLPLATGTWHAVGSHGLWFSSLVFIFSSPFLFSRCSGESQVSGKDFILIFLVLVIVSLGKISTGFVLAAFVGFLLLINFPRKVKVYFLGVALLAFFYFYGGLVSSSIRAEVGSGSGLVFSAHWKMFLAYAPSFFVLGLVSSLLMLVFYFLYGEKRFVVFFIASLGAFFAIYLVTLINPAFTKGDMGYFHIGFSSVVFVGLLCLLVPRLSGLNLLSLRGAGTVFFVLLGYSVVILAPRFGEIPSVTMVRLEPNVYLERLRYHNFEKINSRLDGPSLEIFYVSRNRAVWEDSGLGDSSKFIKLRAAIEDFLKMSGLTKKSSAVFIPAEVYRDDFASMGGHDWAKGLFVYSAVGVKLLNAVGAIPVGYGFSSYGNEAGRLKYGDFSVEKSCMDKSLKAIFIVEAFEPLVYRIAKCSA